MNTKSLKNRTAKCILTICILLITAQLTQAKHHLANEPQDISGTWQVKMDYSNDRQMTAWLAIQPFTKGSKGSRKQAANNRQAKIQFCIW